MQSDSAFSQLPKRWRFVDQPLIFQFFSAAGVVVFFALLSLFLLIRLSSQQNKESHFLGLIDHDIHQIIHLEHDFYNRRVALLEFLRTGDGKYRERSKATGLFSLRPISEIQDIYQEWSSLTENWMSEKVKHPSFQPTAVEMEKESGLFAEIANRIDQIVDSRNHLLFIQDERTSHSTQQTFLEITLITIVLLLIFAIVLSRLYYTVAYPIDELSTGITQYQKGDFTARVSVSNRSQIGFLTANFNEMASRIGKMVGDLKKLDALKSEFVSTVSHELRTPLTSIGGYVKLLVSGDGGELTDIQKEFLHIVDTNVDRLTRLIDDILDVEKMELGKVQIVKEPQDLVSILKECRGTFGIIAARKGLELRFKVPNRLGLVMGDRIRLGQIFINLISNAIKYTPEGFVEIEALEKEFAVLIKVKDSGIGMTPAEEEMIFEKFYRTDSSLLSSEAGSGLGLAITRGLVAAHGGVVSVESWPGKGTVFTVTLPLALSDKQEQAPISVKPESAMIDRRRIRRVWLVDPNPEDSQQMDRILQRAGSSFRGYGLLVETYRCLEEIPVVNSPSEGPVLVILDPKPGDNRDGSWISLIRKKLRKTVPVLAVGWQLEPAAIFAEGASALLTKPVDETEFLIAVKDLINSRAWRVLLADHNTDLRILIKRELEQRGLIVDDVDRGNLVIGRLDQEDYDLALLDSNFPDVSAVDLLKAIRKRPHFENLPVCLMVEGNSSSPSPEERKNSGADYFVEKYEGIGKIVQNVCRYLEGQA